MLKRAAELQGRSTFDCESPALNHYFREQVSQDMRRRVAAYALLVDAKDTTAAAFYRHHGFMALPESPLVLFFPLAGVPRL